MGAFAMQRPPLPPPVVQGQMGAGPPEAPAEPPQPGISGLMPGGPGAAPSPHGALMAQAEAIKRVLEQMAQAEPAFAPFAQRAVSVIESGVAATQAAPNMPPEAPGPPGMPPGGAGQTPPLG